AFIEKRRPPEGGTSDVLSVIGDVGHRRAILVDDEIDTAGSISAAARILADAGVKEIFACAVHGVLSGPAIERRRRAPRERVVLTDSVPPHDGKRIDKIKLISVAPLLAEAIRRIHSDGSVSPLFRT